jgi:uncharacterized repeat protein (TIGR01451 family)
MKQLKIVVGAAFAAVFVLLIAFFARPAESNTTAQPVTHVESTTNLPADVIAGELHGRPLVGVTTQSVFGPKACTSSGDPVSPTTANPWYNDLMGTYHYRIQIPADYPYDIVRVELFDPDSINQQTGNSATVTHSETYFMAFGIPNSTGSCTGPGLQDACVIQTGESFSAANENFYWFRRVDENRGPNRNGSCGRPSSYTPSFNTQTRFELFYQQDNGQGGFVELPLTAYTGQVGDGVRDTGNHLTDLLWVAPGANGVPADCGSATGGDYNPTTCPGGTTPASGRGFEISLSQHLNNIVTDEDGNRYLYLDVTSLSGSSENNFEIWAGPAVYTTTLSNNVNNRNLQLVNQPYNFHSAGVQVYAIGQEPQNSNPHTGLVDVPLAYIPQKYAGAEVSITLFDPDQGSKPPISFYFDTLSEQDFLVEFGAAADPNGRCFDGGAGYNNECNNQWVTPVYTLTIPSTEVAFYGGRLMARYQAGDQDTINWKVTLPPPPVASTAGCSLLPIALHYDQTSRYPFNYQGPPVYGSIDPQELLFMEPGDFDIPVPGPWYQVPNPALFAGVDDFYFNLPGFPLIGGQAGYLYLARQQGLGSGSFTWLSWNDCDAQVCLADSLDYPGNFWQEGEYIGSDTDLDMAGVNWNGQEQIEGDGDGILEVGEWVHLNTGNVNSNDVHDNLQDLFGRPIMLPIYDANAGFGTSAFVRISGFVIARTVGWDFTGNPKQLAFELVEWSDACTTSADLTITKADSPDPVVVGQPLAYMIVVGNQGPDPAANVVITDTLPAGVTIANMPATCSGVSTIVCDIGYLAAGGGTSLVINTYAPMTAGVITNSVTVASGTADPNPNNNFATEHTTIIEEADFADLELFSKVDSQDPVVYHQSFDYTITIRNNGPAPANNIVVNDSLPNSSGMEVAFVSVTTTMGQCIHDGSPTGGNVVCAIPAMTLNETATITISVIAPNSVGTFFNTASITGDETDPIPANNSKTEDTSVLEPLVDLALTKSDSPDPVTVGQNLVYGLFISNNGPAAATNVVTVDALPAGVTLVSAVASQGSCSPNSGIVTCSLGTIAFQGNATVAITVVPTAAGTINNTASVDSDETDVDTSNNTDTEPTTVNTGASNTGLVSPQANAAIITGDRNGYQLNPTFAYSDNGQSAEDTNSGYNASTSCSDPGKDGHRFYSYPLTVPANALVTGIEVRLDARADSAAASPFICVQLSWDGGASWTAAKLTPVLGTAETTYLLGGPADTWGHTWNPAGLSANLQVRLTNVAANTGRDFYLDWIAVRVYYQ